MDIGKRLRAWREANGLSQSELEGRTGLVCSCISQVEEGHTLPTLPVLETWVKALPLTSYCASIASRCTFHNQG
ncbi:MAG: helix-turn-helix transcriptional regulator [Terriglobia bacterium]